MGSSRISTRQSPASALRISTRCCSPTERSATLASARTRIPNRSAASSTLLPGRFEIDQQPLGPAESQILGDGHRRHQREVLGDHPDPGGDRIAGRADRKRTAIDQDLPLVGAGEAIEDPHQGCLAGAVLAENPVHLTGPQAEIDRVVGDQARRTAW